MEEGCAEQIMSHTRIKIGLGKDERGKGEIMKWMREVKKLRKYIRGG